MRLVKSTKLREGGGQVKICDRKISVGLDRPPKPRDRLLPTAEMVLRDARESHPEYSHRIARTEAQGLDNVSLCFFGATDKNLAQSDQGMGVGKISIQLQRMFTLGDALRRALGHMSTSPKYRWPRAWSGTNDKALVNFASAAAKAAIGIGHEGIRARESVRARRSNERVDIAGIGGERAIEKAARLRDIVRGSDPY